MPAPNHQPTWQTTVLSGGKSLADEQLVRRLEPGFTKQTGEFMQGIGGYAALVPADLYPEIEWTSELVRDLSRAERALGQLSGV